MAEYTKLRIIEANDNVMIRYISKNKPVPDCIITSYASRIFYLRGVHTSTEGIAYVRYVEAENVQQLVDLNKTPKEE